jgi:DNA-directed RNA polymerase subunit RPC12/RpoP
MAQGDDPRYVRVVCTTCRAVLHPRVEKAGRRVVCPDCYSAVLVPQPPKPEPPPKLRDAGEYGVREARAPARPEKDSDEFFPVLCPLCQARLHPKRAHAGKRARCPDCDTVFVIPPPPKPTENAPPPPPGKYTVGAEPKREQPTFDRLIVEREPEPEPPAPPDKLWFAAGVFTFPWWPGAWSRWIVLAMLFVPALIMAGIVGLLSGAFAGVNPATTAVPYLMAPLMWFWLWALSYAAGCFVAIVQDTGSGNDEVASWPEGDWRERVVTMLYVGLHFGLAMAAASALAWPVGTFYGPAWMGLVVALAANFLFPLFLLASMEADTLLTPYSAVIFGSVLKGFAGWLTVYVESLVVLGFTAGLLAAGLYFVPLVTLLLAAPLLATAVFVEARLYGRLAWHIGQAEMARRPRKRKKKSESRGTTADRSAKFMPSKG